VVFGAIECPPQGSSRNTIVVAVVGIQLHLAICTSRFGMTCRCPSHTELSVQQYPRFALIEKENRENICQHATLSYTSKPGSMWRGDENEWKKREFKYSFFMKRSEPILGRLICCEIMMSYGTALGACFIFKVEMLRLLF